MTYSEAELYQLINVNLFVLFRVGAIFTVAPMFSSQLIPMKLRLVTALAVSMMIATTIDSSIVLPDFSLQLVLMAMNQVLIGALIGFVFQIVFQIMIVAGQIIAMQAGLGFASLIDPSSGASVPVVSQFYLLLFTLVFLALNGHLMLIELLTNSFTTMPLTSQSSLADNIWQMITFSSWIFKGAVLMALPIIISLLLVNLAFGVLARAAPQLNIFAIGFPISLTIGLLLVYITLAGVLPQMEAFLESGFSMANTMVGN